MIQELHFTSMHSELVNNLTLSFRVSVEFKNDGYTHVGMQRSRLSGRSGDFLSDLSGLHFRRSLASYRGLPDILRVCLGPSLSLRSLLLLSVPDSECCEGILSKFKGFTASEEATSQVPAKNLLLPNVFLQGGVGGWLRGSWSLAR
ncbi:hypothetical protein Tco_1009854 [Tanacetum coccineum]